ncbi:MAG: alpha/beta fold hydrolase [Bacteriovorax sp.]|nr:alpha/beta fold hydrolase [Bacteriovorax sp.]
MKSFLKPIVTFILLSSNVFALSEIGYQKNYQEKISPFIKTLREGSFIGKNGVAIHYRTLISQKANNCLVILPGRTEPVEKYAEVVYDLLQTNAGKNLNFYLMDHRGQGSSDRMKAPLDMGYVDRFENYVADVESFVTLQKLDQNCDQKFLLAHSLGAGIATAFILKNPHTFDRVAFSSPMLKIKTAPYPYGVARTIVEASTIAGRGAKFAIGQKSFNPDSKFEENTFTTSPERFSMTMSMFDLYPKSRLGGVANRWILEVMKGTNPLRSRYHEISVPMHVFNAGIEVYSEPSEMIKLCDEAVNCKRTFLETSKHEVMMDRDVNRNIVIRELSDFFN